VRFLKIPHNIEKVAVLLILSIALVSFWILDISVWKLGGDVTNGFWSVGAEKSYHLALFASVLSTIVLSVMLIMKGGQDVP